MTRQCRQGGRVREPWRTDRMAPGLPRWSEKGSPNPVECSPNLASKQRERVPASCASPSRVTASKGRLTN